jgi:hypothetical protein
MTNAPGSANPEAFTPVPTSLEGHQSMDATIHHLPVPSPDPASVALRVLREIVGFAPEEIRAWPSCPVRDALDAAS